MTKRISRLLNAEEPLFAMTIQDLERDSGKTGVDIKLEQEITEKIRQKSKQLGLDPNDTKPEELYWALLNLIDKQDKHLVEKIGGKNPNDPEELMPLMKTAWQKTNSPKTAWVLKKSVAKKMLKKTPPKNIMKHLKYRSVDSMLKNENIGEIYGALRFAESPTWLNSFNKQYYKLTPSDFETRPIEVIQMPVQRWGDISIDFIKKKKHNITHVKEMGVIIMLPVGPATHLKAITIFVLPLLFHYLNEIRLYSAFFKLKQVQPDFGKIIVETLIADPSKAATLSGHHVHWRVIQRYFGKLEKENHPELFQPHVQPEDLHWRRAEEMMTEIDSELEFWDGLDYVALLDGKRPVALNMLDVAANFVNDTPYEKRVFYHFADALWNEIFMRYMGQNNLEDQILKQLDNDLIEPEDLSV